MLKKERIRRNKASFIKCKIFPNYCVHKECEDCKMASNESIEQILFLNFNEFTFKFVKVKK